MTTHENADFVKPEVCYHRHRVIRLTDYLSGGYTLTCEDCGATAKAGYNCPLPELPPMPVEESNAA